MCERVGLRNSKEVPFGVGAWFASIKRRAVPSIDFLAALAMTMGLVLVLAQPAQAQQNNNVQVQCDGSGKTFFLCQDGNSCGRIVSDGPAPFSSANSGQDNVDFTGLAVGESAQVSYELERVIVPSFTYGQQNQFTFNDTQSNPARGDITDTSNASTAFAVSNTASVGPFSVTNTGSVASTRHSIDLLQPAQTPNSDPEPNPDYNFLKYTVTCTKVVQGTIKIIKAKDAASDQGANDPDFSFELDGNAVGTQLKVGNSVDVQATANTPHALTEVSIPLNWSLTSATCDSMQSPGSVQVAPGQTVTCTFTNKFTAVDDRQGTITIKKIKDAASDPGADNPDFSFQVDGQPVATKLKVGGMTDVSVAANQAHAVSEVALPQNWSLTGATCDKGQTPASVTVAPGDVVTCTFENKFTTPKDPRMEEETKRFIHRRVDNLLTHGPDRARLLRRLQDGEPPVSLKDSGPLKFSGDGRMARNGATMFGSGLSGLGVASGESVFGNEEETRDVTNPTGETVRNPFFDSLASQASKLGMAQSGFKFGTSLSQLREVAAAQEAAKQEAKLKDSGLSFAGQGMANPYIVPRTGFDIWMEGHVSRYKDDIGGVNRDGDFRVLYVGADYVLAPGILIGALIQVDDTSEDINQALNGETGKIDGTGWMAGPYIGVRLNEKLYFDARAAWGTSSNDIYLNDNVNGARTGSFDTTRWLASATLTGNERFGAWRFSPQVSLAYGHEEYDTYINSKGISVNGGEATIGRFTGGIEVGYQFRTAYGTTIEPHVSITGIYNFDSDDLVINGVLVQSDESRAKIEGGVIIMTPTGWGVRAAANFDGIGSDEFKSYGGSLWINVPLN